MDFRPFTEKYRPSTLEQVIGHEDIISSLKHFSRTRNMPNLLFSGPPGIGKTTSALALAREMFGEDWRASFLELNASDERGIDIVRGKVKDFARVSPLSSVPFKLIFLDEADALTQEAQQALRRTMEMYSSVTRFILSCNYSSKIIEPIQSRCSVFRFRHVEKDSIISMLDRVCKEEGLSADQGAREALVRVSEGDMRKLLNVLQAAGMHSKQITKELVEKISGTVSITEMDTLMNSIRSANFMQAVELVNRFLVDYGLGGEELITQLYKHVLDAKIDERIKIECIDAIGEFHFRITEGSNENIQLRALVARLCRIMVSRQ